MFKTYMASAGAGKTTSLVAEYLTICLRDDRSVGQFRNILAVTFTNNATAEMKGRIVETLQQFAFQPQSEWGGSAEAIAGMVMKALPGLTLQQLQHRSEMLLAEILYDYPNFSISTIDSFFQRIVRAFAFELGISMSYEVEVTLDDCFQQTVDLLLNRISKENPDLRDAVMELVEEQMSSKGRWRIEGQLLDLLRVIYGDEAAAEPLAALSATDQLKACLKRQAESVKEARDQLLQVSEGANTFLESIGLDDKQLVKGRANGSIYCWFTQFDPFTIKLYSCLNDLEHAYFLKSEGGESDGLNAKIIARCQELLQAQENYSHLKVLYGRMKTLSLLFDLKSIMDEIRERDNKFFLSDTNYKIYSEIKEQDTPFIYEKIGNRYRYFFIDEFQDTSRMQWQDLIPLLKNALSFSDGEVILFGDVKQAIYRFRNGDAQLLTDLSAKPATAEYLNLLPNDVKCSRRKMEPMKVNYRSDGNIVNFNNAFFEHMPELDGFKEVMKKTEGSEAKNVFAELYRSYYQSVVQEVREGKEGRGVVCVRFMGEDDDKSDYFEQQVNAAVADALDKGYRLSDIAVLTSSNDDGSFLGQTLSAAGYKVISSESLLLCTSPEVNLVLAVLSYVCRPNDKLAQYVIAHYVLNRDRKDVSAQLEKLIPKMGDEKEFSQFMEEQGVKLNRQQLAGKPLYTLVTEVLRLFSISEADAFVIALMDNILDYLKTQNGEVASFLDWWERKGSGLALKAPSGLDAITISTIHKAKGLQYPVVILPFTQYGQSLTKKDYWYAKEDEEVPYLLLKMEKSLDELGLGNVFEREGMLSVMDSLNKIYVAQTRAENRMYILTGRQDSAKGNYNRMLYDFVQKPMGKEDKKVEFVQEEGDELCYWWGNRNERRKDKDKKEECQCDDITQMYCAGFDLEDLSTHVVKAETREQEVGNAIHDYLSRQTHFPLTEGDVNTWEIDDSQPYADEIRDALRCIARHTEWHPYFAEGVKVLNEVSILPTREFMRQDSREGEVRPRLTYRPDRVVQLEDGVVVLDYKTGHPTEAARAAYERQVATYVALLGDMALGPVRGEVLYLNEV